VTNKKIGRVMLATNLIMKRLLVVEYLNIRIMHNALLI
jgi:hypothetical protein